MLIFGSLTIRHVQQSVRRVVSQITQHSKSNSAADATAAAALKDARPATDSNDDRSMCLLYFDVNSCLDQLDLCCSKT
jgi:hypothetical protein